jgi:RNA polymerase sigma factor (sigma-70 family)
MSSDGSVSRWIRAVKQSDGEAMRQLWERYFTDLVSLCRKRLTGRARAQDEEDAALSAFESFYRGAIDGRFPDLRDRENLWKLLVVIAARKANRIIAQDQAQKRGAGRVIDETALRNGTDIGLDEIVSHELTPEFVARFSEEFERRLDALSNDLQRSVALLKLEGYTNDEIAAKLGCSIRTVERKLEYIRDLWERELVDSADY